MLFELSVSIWLIVHSLVPATMLDNSAVVAQAAQ